MWIGGEMYMDNTDIFSRFKASLSYTYKLKVQNEQFIYFGVWGSFYQNALNYANAVGVDPNDPLFKDITNITASKFNAGFGLNYSWKQFNIGFSIPTLFSSRQEVENNLGVTFNQKQEFLFHVSNIFRFSDNLDMQSWMVFRKTTNDPLNFEISAMFIYMKRFWSGLLFRKGGALGINLGGNLVKGLTFNYSYEIPVGGINARSGGGHEITLGWRFGSKSGKYFEYNDEYYQNPRKTNYQPKSRKNYPPIYDYRYRKINK
jgi:type IX secretion system PorP/SprF family membrane protein